MPAVDHRGSLSLTHDRRGQGAVAAAPFGAFRAMFEAFCVPQKASKGLRNSPNEGDRRPYSVPAHLARMTAQRPDDIFGREGKSHVRHIHPFAPKRLLRGRRRTCARSGPAGVVSVVPTRAFERFRLAAGSHCRRGERARRRRGDRDRRPRPRLRPGRACRPRSVERCRAPARPAHRPAASLALARRRGGRRARARRRRAGRRRGVPRHRLLRRPAMAQHARRAHRRQDRTQRGLATFERRRARARRRRPRLRHGDLARDGARSSFPQRQSSASRRRSWRRAGSRAAIWVSACQPVKLEGGGLGLMAMSVDARARAQPASSRATSSSPGTGKGSAAFITSCAR